MLNGRASRQRHGKARHGPRSWGGMVACGTVLPGKPYVFPTRRLSSALPTIRYHFTPYPAEFTQ